MKNKIINFYIAASFQIGVNIIGLPEIFHLKKPIYQIQKSLFHI